jgi:hypothetical protein
MPPAARRSPTKPFIESGRITAVGASAPKIPKTARTIDLPENSASRFWDMHVHLAGINADPSWSKVLLLPLLANGITGVRDMGGDLTLSSQRDIESGALLGPPLPPARSLLRAGRKPRAVSRRQCRRSPRRGRRLQKRGANFIKIISMPRAMRSSPGR